MEKEIKIWLKRGRAIQTNNEFEIFLNDLNQEKQGNKKAGYDWIEAAWKIVGESQNKEWLEKFMDHDLFKDEITFYRNHEWTRWEGPEVLKQWYQMKKWILNARESALSSSHFNEQFMNQLEDLRWGLSQAWRKHPKVKPKDSPLCITIQEVIQKKNGKALVWFLNRKEEKLSSEQRLEAFKRMSEKGWLEGVEIGLDWEGEHGNGSSSWSLKDFQTIFFSLTQGEYFKSSNHSKVAYLWIRSWMEGGPSALACPKKWKESKEKQWNIKEGRYLESFLGCSPSNTYLRNVHVSAISLWSSLVKERSLSQQPDWQWMVHVSWGPYFQWLERKNTMHERSIACQGSEKKFKEIEIAFKEEKEKWNKIYALNQNIQEGLGFDECDVILQNQNYDFRDLSCENAGHEIESYLIYEYKKSLEINYAATCLKNEVEELNFWINSPELWLKDIQSPGWYVPFRARPSSLGYGENQECVQAFLESAYMEQSFKTLQKSWNESAKDKPLWLWLDEKNLKKEHNLMSYKDNLLSETPKFKETVNEKGLMKFESNGGLASKANIKLEIKDQEGKKSEEFWKEVLRHYPEMHVMSAVKDIIGASLWGGRGCSTLEYLDQWMVQKGEPWLGDWKQWMKDGLMTQIIDTYYDPMLEWVIFNSCINQDITKEMTDSWERQIQELGDNSWTEGLDVIHRWKSQWEHIQLKQLVDIKEEQESGHKIKKL